MAVLALVLLPGSALFGCATPRTERDIVVYGGTSAGVIAAAAADSPMRPRCAASNSFR